MNNKGQSLVFFILILPILALFLVFVTRMLLVEYDNNHNKNVIKDNLKMILSNDLRDLDKIKNNLANEIKYQTIDLFIIDDRINISISIKDNNLIKNKIINYDYCGNYVSKEIINNRCI